MTVTFHSPKYRLKAMLRQAGGKTVADAVKDADAALQHMAGDCLIEVDRALERVNAHWARAGADIASSGGLRSFYEDAAPLIGLASVAGLKALDRAAYSLCDLLDRMIDNDILDRDSITVHVQSLNLLRNLAILDNREAVEQVLRGLHKVRGRYEIVERAAAPGSVAAGSC